LLRSSISRALVLAGACLSAISPFWWWGSPSGHDFEFHVYSWMEVLGQWKHGIVYPRWAGLAHFGYGEARFLFYPPASWTLGALLGAVLPWKIVPGAYCWIVLTLAGSAMYHLARQWLRPRDAMFAAVFYALNPYHLLIVYWRSAYAELLAAALLPLLLLCLLRIRQRIDEPSLQPTLWLGLTLAGAWLTNVPAAVMIHYSVVVLTLVLIATSTASSSGASGAHERFWSRRNRRLLVRTAAAILLGASLASFYLLPAIYEQRWIDVSQVLSPGVRPQDNFLFTTIADPDHNRFNRLVSTIALGEIGLLAFAMWLSLRNRARGLKTAGLSVSLPDDSATLAHSLSEKTSWMLLTAWGTASAFFMLSASHLLWQHLPKFRFVQLPFRWLLCLNAALAGLLAMSIRRWTSRLLLCASLLVALIIGGGRIQPPWWDTAADIREMRDAVADGIGYEGTDEYVPDGADASELNRSLPRVSDDTGAPVQSKMPTWGPTEKRFTVRAAEDENLTVRLFSYPAWDVTINGRPAATLKTDVTGLIVIPIPAGDSDIDIHFRRTTDRAAGAIASLIALFVFIAAWLRPAWFQTLRIAPRRREEQPADLRRPAA
jgi:hypothetical protein